MDYAIGDIHGCFKSLKLLIEKIYNSSPDNSYYFLGDYIDRGPESKKVLDFLIELKKSNLNVYLLRGNHEQMMIDSFKKQNSGDYLLWKKNGSEATLKDFNIMYDTLNLQEYIPKSYIEFAESLPYFAETKNCFLVHAGFNFNSLNPFKDTDSMLWTREDSINIKFTKGKKIVHGHMPTTIEQINFDLENNSDILSIDTGCVFKQIPGLGYLSALNLKTWELISVKNIDF